MKAGKERTQEEIQAVFSATAKKEVETTSEKYRVVIFVVDR